MSGTGTECHDREVDLSTCEECLPPAEAFALIGNETRLAILEALWESEDRPVSFSALRRRVGMRDSAQFNYHLGKLAGHFVHKGEAGYDFKEAGRKVVSAVLAGSFTEHPELDPFRIDSPCAVCGAPLQARYEDERFAIECTRCGHGHGEYPFPPGGLHDRSREEVMAAFDERVCHLHCLAADGVCPECNGRMASTFERDPECCLGVDVQVHHRCGQCGHELCSPVGLVLLDDADVVTFYRDHGIDLPAKPYWELEWCVSDANTRILSEEPWRVEIRIPLGDEELRAVVEEELSVTVTRNDRADAPARVSTADDD